MTSAFQPWARPDSSDVPGWVRGRGHPLLVAWVECANLPQLVHLADVETLERARLQVEAVDGIERPSFARQDAALLADGLHYEERIASFNVVATREHHAHDLFNAMMWLRHPLLKRALNARQIADIGIVGSKRRTRGQYALTHFDEAGAIAWLADPALLPLWDAHDWPALFLRERAAWGRRIALTVFGHALYEHVWAGRVLPVAKTLVVRVDAHALASMPVDEAGLLGGWPRAEACVADAVRAARLLLDPQELRPLPLAGVPGWHAGHDSEAFVRDAPCFRPLRAGRRYPAPLRFDA